MSNNPIPRLANPSAASTADQEEIIIKEKFVEALFTSRVFERIGGDYPVSRNIPDRFF
jgi:hypothetical protein